MIIKKKNGITSDTINKCWKLFLELKCGVSMKNYEMNIITKINNYSLNSIIIVFYLNSLSIFCRLKWI